MIIINNNQRHSSLHLSGTTPAQSATRQQRIATLLQQCLEKIPPKPFNRCLRAGFMLYLSGLRSIPPQFESLLLELLAIMELLDEQEDENG